MKEVKMSVEQEQQIIYEFLHAAEQILDRGKVPNRAGVLRTLRAYVPYWQGSANYRS